MYTKDTQEKGIKSLSIFFLFLFILLINSSNVNAEWTRPIQYLNGSFNASLLDNYVPYIGATQNVDLTSRNLTSVDAIRIIDGNGFVYDNPNLLTDTFALFQLNETICILGFCGGKIQLNTSKGEWQFTKVDDNSATNGFNYATGNYHNYLGGINTDYDLYVGSDLRDTNIGIGNVYFQRQSGGDRVRLVSSKFQTDELLFEGITTGSRDWIDFGNNHRIATEPGTYLDIYGTNGIKFFVNNVLEMFLYNQNLELSNGLNVIIKDGGNITQVNNVNISNNLDIGNRIYFKSNQQQEEAGIHWEGTETDYSGFKRNTSLIWNSANFTLEVRDDGAIGSGSGYLGGYYPIAASGFLIGGTGTSAGTDRIGITTDGLNLYFGSETLPAFTVPSDGISPLNLYNWAIYPNYAIGDNLILTGGMNSTSSTIAQLRGTSAVFTQRITGTVGISSNLGNFTRANIINVNSTNVNTTNLKASYINDTGNLNMYGNFTGNMYHVGMGTSSETGIGGSTLNATYQPVNFTTFSHASDSGFILTNYSNYYNQTSLQLVDPNGIGEYFVNWNTFKIGTNNHNYYGKIFVNEVAYNLTMGPGIGQNSNAVQMEGSGYIFIPSLGSNVTLRMKDTTAGGSTPSVYIKKVNIIRVSNNIQ